MSDSAENLTKVHIDLPHHWGTGGESLWVRPLGRDLYELRNVPFYAYDLNYLDVVHATEDAPDLKPSVRRVVRRSGHRTLRVFADETISPEHAVELLSTLQKSGASFERATARYFALDIEPNGDYDAITAQLEKWENDGLLAYETCEARVSGSFDDLPGSRDELDAETS